MSAPAVVSSSGVGATALQSLPVPTGVLCASPVAGLSLVPMAATPVYCATKAAVRSFTVSLRYQLREGTVRVIEIIPPAVQSDLHSFMGAKGKDVRTSSCSDASPLQVLSPDYRPCHSATWR